MSRLELLLLWTLHHAVVCKVASSSFYFIFLSTFFTLQNLPTCLMTHRCLVYPVMGWENTSKLDFIHLVPRGQSQMSVQSDLFCVSLPVDRNESGSFSWNRVVGRVSPAGWREAALLVGRKESEVEAAEIRVRAIVRMSKRIEILRIQGALLPFNRSRIRVTGRLVYVWRGKEVPGDACIV